MPLRPVSRFPQPVQSRVLKAGSREVVYSFQVPRWHVAFISAVGSKPPGLEPSWAVDGELVDFRRERITVGSVEKPSLIRPPIVCKRETVLAVEPSADGEYAVLLDGEVHEMPLTRRDIAEAVESALRQIEAPRLKHVAASTFIIDQKGVVVAGTWEICDEKGPGSLHELLLIAPSSSFDLTVIVDGRTYKGTYSDYAAYSEYIDEIAAFQSDGNYRVHLSGISFSQRLRAYVTGNLTLTKVFAKYELAEEAAP